MGGVLNMGLFNYFSDLKSNFNEKKIAQAEALGHCPECNGKGFQIPVVNEYFYPDSFDCPSCNGTGHYSNWSENKQSYS
jgi:DnaJ-class molecular chaperone